DFEPAPLGVVVVGPAAVGQSVAEVREDEEVREHEGVPTPELGTFRRGHDRDTGSLVVVDHGLDGGAWKVLAGRDSLAHPLEDPDIPFQNLGVLPFPYGP